MKLASVVYFFACLVCKNRDNRKSDKYGVYDGTASSGTYGDTKGCRIYDMLCVKHVYKQVLRVTKKFTRLSRVK